MAKILYKSGSNWVNAALAFYPVGAVYIHYSGAHTSNTNNTPANQFGGTWAQLSSGYALTTITSGTSATTAATKHTHYYSLGYSAYHGSLIGPDLGAISLYDYDGAHGGDHLGGYWTQGTNDGTQSQPKNNGLVGGSTYIDSVRVRHEAAVSGTQLTTDQLPRITVWCWRRTA